MGVVVSITVELENRTPFVAATFLLPDGRGQEAVLVLLSAEFEIGAEGRATPAGQQRELALVDEYSGDPGNSSVVRDHDIVLEKPMVDVLVHGSGYAPGGRPTERTMVELHLGDVHKQLLVSGDRQWLGAMPSAAQPFVTMPLVWERAYGGPHEPRNPVGLSGEDGLPNIEDPNALLLRRGQPSRPACLGPVARTWAPRSKWVGTYDQAWLDRRWPLLPDDHDARSQQSASRDQWLGELHGNELGIVRNMTPDGVWRFCVPTLDVPVHLSFADRAHEAELRIDTLELEPVANRLTLTARLAIPVLQDRAPLEGVVLGHVPPGWLRARRLKKIYVDLRSPGREE